MTRHPFHSSLATHETCMSIEGSSVCFPIEHRRDPLMGMHTSLLSQVRINRPGKPAPSPQGTHQKEGCIFEPAWIAQTPEPRTYHPSLVRDGYVPVTVPNRYPYALKGSVTSFTNHERCSLEKLEQRDWVAYLLLSHHAMTQDILEGYTSSFNFLNFGRVAGASQEHPHFQTGVFPEHLETTSDRERTYIYAQGQKDPFQAHIEQSHSAGLLCASQGDALIIAPYAPRFPDQLDIIVASPCPHLLACEEEVINSLASSLERATQFLSQKRGVTDLNIILHQERLDRADSPYRLHFHLYPRNKNVLAGIEVGSGMYVVDTYPEETARAFREWNR